MKNGEIIGEGDLQDVPTMSKVSWKDKFIGNTKITDNGLEENEDFVLLEGDI